MVSDVAAIGLTLFALRFAQRSPTSTRTYGHQRVEILAALVNGATLIGVAIFIVVEAIDRFRNPSTVAGPLMMAVAGGGLVVNLVALWLLRDSYRDGLNMRGAWLHVLMDALGSVQAILAAAVIWVWGWYWADPLTSVLIAGLVVHSSWDLVRSSVDVLMEGVPEHIELDAVTRTLVEIPGVHGVHDLHVWSITSGFVALSAHLVIEKTSDADEILRVAEGKLNTEFHIAHSTIQMDVGAPCSAHLH